MKIFSDLVNSFVSNPGSRIHQLFSPSVDRHGVVILVPSGTEDTDAFIQSFKDSTDIAFILAKLKQGDDSVLRQRIGSYGDFTKVPKTFAESLQMQIDAKEMFDRLDPSVKVKFGNDINQFLASAGSADWFDNLGLINPVDKPVDTSNLENTEKEV